MRWKTYSLIKSISSGNLLKNWGAFEPAPDIQLKDCVEVLAHLKNIANIPSNDSIWNRSKIDRLVNSTIKRKVLYVVLNWLCREGLFLNG